MVMVSIFYPEVLEPGSHIFPSRTEWLDQWFSIAFGLQKFPSRSDNAFMVSLDLLRLFFSSSLTELSWLWCMKHPGSCNL